MTLHYTSPNPELRLDQSPSVAKQVRVPEWRSRSVVPVFVRVGGTLPRTSS